MVWDSHLLNFPQFVVIHTVKDFRIVNEAEAGRKVGFVLILVERFWVI